MIALLTVGHGTTTEAELGDRLRAAGVRALVDVRTAPGSRRSPHLSRTGLAGWLPAYGVSYRWEPRLGGFRRLPADPPDGLGDPALRNESFRAYAAHMRTPDFGAAIGELLADAAGRRTAVLCSETVWWRCHRRLIADFAALARGVDVRHLMPDRRLTPHVVTAGARLDPASGLLRYDGQS